MTFISHCLRLLLLLLFLIPLVTTSETIPTWVINTGWNLVTNANVAAFIANFAVRVLYVNGKGTITIINLILVRRLQILSVKVYPIKTISTTYEVILLGFFINGPALAIGHASQQVVQHDVLRILFTVHGPLKLENPNIVGPYDFTFSTLDEYTP
ncbi:hypothetical protein AXF42_Ash014861 [Apostasia shenzhenica]|uniref:Uncharacterized protein n=1 Tax=Apostasia shenzhenica TaxID=1088818 RepID=A0A2I0ALB3_9ASPA|nr:hypothetical protein AXF42_Ash014861 [Apostasia shenzhenica]